MHNVQQGQELASILQRTWDLRELAAASHLFEHMLAQPGSTAILLPRVYNLVVFKTFPPCRQLAHMMPNVECLTVPGNSTIGRFGVPFETATLEVELDRLWPNLRALVVDYMTPVRLLSCEHHMSHLEVSFEPPHPRPYHLWRATEPVIEPSMTLTHLVLKSTHPPQQFTSAFFQALPALRVLEVGLHVALTSLGPMRMGVGQRDFWAALITARLSNLRYLRVIYGFAHKHDVPKSPMRIFASRRVAELPPHWRPPTLELLSINTIDRDGLNDLHPAYLRWQWKRRSKELQDSDITPSSLVPSGMEPIEFKELQQHISREGYRWPSRYSAVGMRPL